MFENLIKELKHIENSLDSDPDINNLCSSLDDFILRERDSEEEINYLINLGKRFNHYRKINSYPWNLKNEIIELFKLYKTVLPKFLFHSLRSNYRRKHLLDEINNFEYSSSQEEMYEIAYRIICHMYSLYLDEFLQDVDDNNTDISLLFPMFFESIF